MQETIFEGKKIISFKQKGTGVPILFLHGFCADSSIWNDFILQFPNHFLLRIDLPGFGLSEQIPAYSITRYADVIKAVLDAHKIEQCIFIGHSMGGYVALEFAKKYPDRLKGLCLFHSHPYQDTSEKTVTRQKSIDFIKTNGHIYYVKQLIPALFPPGYAGSNHLEVAKLVYTASKYSADNIVAGLEAMMDRSDNADVLEQLDFPILFIVGKEDTIVPQYQAAMAKATIASIEILPDVAHMGMLESPKKCGKRIKAYLKLLEILA